MRTLQLLAWPNVYDIVVVGGGPAGVAAMWECVHAGAKVLIVDAQGFPGGAAAAGFCGFAGLHVGDCRISGIEDEFIRKLRERGGLLPVSVAMVVTSGSITSELEQPPLGSRGYLFVPEIVKQTMLDLITATDAKVLFHVQALGFVEEKDERRLVVAMKEGLRTLKARVFVDATGGKVPIALIPSDQVFMAIGAQIRMKEVPKGVCLRLSEAELVESYRNDGLLIQAIQGTLYFSPLDSEFGYFRLLTRVLLSKYCKKYFFQTSMLQSLGLRLLHAILNHWEQQFGEEVELLTSSPCVYVTSGSLGYREVGSQLQRAATSLKGQNSPLIGGVGLLQEDFPIFIWKDSWWIHSPFAMLETMDFPYRALLASGPGLILAGGALATKFGVACTALPISFAFATGQAAGRLAIYCLDKGLENIWTNGIV